MDPVGRLRSSIQVFFFPHTAAWSFFQDCNSNSSSSAMAKVWGSSGGGNGPHSCAPPHLIVGSSRSVIYSAPIYIYYMAPIINENHTNPGMCYVHTMSSQRRLTDVLSLSLCSFCHDANSRTAVTCLSRRCLIGRIQIAMFHSSLKTFSGFDAFFVVFLFHTLSDTLSNLC